MGYRATCPHCGAHLSRIRNELRCSCGWADPREHQPYRRSVELDLTEEEARAFLDGDTAAVEAEVTKQLESPLISMADGEPVLFTEPYVYVKGDDLPLGLVGAEIAIEQVVEAEVTRRLEEAKRDAE